MSKEIKIRTKALLLAREIYPQATKFDFLWDRADEIYEYLTKKAPAEATHEERLAQSEMEEQKTAGLNFLEAIRLCKDGHNVRRSVWNKDSYIGESSVNIYKLITNSGEPFLGDDLRSLLATDWEIVKP